MYFLKFMKAKLLPCRPYRRQLSPATFIPAICSKLLEAKELWLPVWVSSNYLSFKIDCVGASCIDGSAVSENVSLIQLRKNYLLILDAWNTSLIRVSLGELSWNFTVSGEKNGEGRRWGDASSRENWIIQWKKCIIHHVTLEGTNLDIRPFKNTEQQNSQF